MNSLSNIFSTLGTTIFAIMKNVSVLISSIPVFQFNYSIFYKMKKYILLTNLIAVLIFTSCHSPQSKWHITENPILTQWASDVDPENPWPEYPRPQMVRENWLNLNGLWDYAILPKENSEPSNWDGKILVPYPVESALSGVKKRITPEQKLWYHTTFRIPEEWEETQKIILHFEAVDWETTIYINGKSAGMHKGGYDPFNIDITPFLKKKGKQNLVISVWDPTDAGFQPRGKQVSNPGGIWYTPVTGIWQTVWLEPVNSQYINNYKLVPDIDNEKVTFYIHSSDKNQPADLQIKVLNSNGEIAFAEGNTASPVEIKIPDPELWSPDNPFLYDIEITLTNNGQETDHVSGYFGMRKISLGKDEKGLTRIFLNNMFLFQNGPLDQGFWPDGIYTPPTEEAMKYDLEVIKKLGFNMLRKHVKIESRRFYYLCDKMGLLVWQDMPSGDKYIGRNDPDIERTPESKKQFEFELLKLIATKYNHPCIVMWVPFNEGWGQFDTEGIVRFIKDLDPTRLVNSASGWTDRGVGDVHDIHNYPEPRTPEPEEDRAIVLGEFGGLGLPVEKHTWVEKAWGYQKMENFNELLNTYEQFYKTVWQFKDDPGLSAAVYTQTTDVETETNGLMTYDRKIIKLNPGDAYKINTNQ